MNRRTLSLIASCSVFLLATTASADPPAQAAPAASAVSPQQVRTAFPSSASSRATDGLAAPRKHRRSTGLFVTGIVLSSAGVLAAVVGLAAMQSSSNFQSSCKAADEALKSAGEPGVSCQNDTGRAGEIGLMIGGAAAFAVGLPLVFIGGTKVDDEPSTEARLAVVPSAHGASAKLSIAF